MPTPISQLPDPVRVLDVQRRAALGTSAFGDRSAELIALERALSRPGPLWMRHPPGWLARLRPRIKAQWDAGRGQRFKRLLQYVVRVAPDLAAEPWVFGLFALSEMPDLRPLADWDGYLLADPARRFRHLVTHLALRWTLPEFLLDELQQPSLRHTPLLAHVARGGSVRAVAGTALLPPPLTRRTVHRLLTAPAPGECLEEIVRRTQLRELGAAPELVTAVADTWLADRFVAPDLERRWAAILGWMVRNQDAMPADDVPRIVGFLSHEPIEVVGRGAAGLLELARAWTPPSPVAAMQVRPTARYRSSGFGGGRVLLEGDGDDAVEWTIQELRSWRALFREGRKMRHCVSLYAARVRNGHCSIWSLRRNGARVLTVEVRNHQGEIVQVRGHCNRRATDHERAVLARWASKTRLSL